MWGAPAWLWQPFSSADPTAVSLWPQPVQGTGSLAQYAARFHAAAVIASRLGWHWAEHDGPAGDQPDTWTQEVSGASSRLARAQWQWWQRVVTTQGLRQQPPQDFSIVEEEAPWTQPVQGTVFLQQAARDFWRRAASRIQTDYVFTEPAPAEPDTYTVSVPGTRILPQLGSRAVVAAYLAMSPPQDESAPAPAAVVGVTEALLGELIPRPILGDFHG